MIPMAWQRLAPMHMLISAHPDGQIIADAVTYFGVDSIAGFGFLRAMAGEAAIQQQRRDVALEADRFCERETGNGQ